MRLKTALDVSAEARCPAVQAKRTMENNYCQPEERELPNCDVSLGRFPSYLLR